MATGVLSTAGGIYLANRNIGTVKDSMDAIGQVLPSEQGLRASQAVSAGMERGISAYAYGRIHRAGQNTTTPFPEKK